MLQWLFKKPENSFKKTQSKIRNMCDYLLNISKRRQNLIRFIIVETGFPIGSISIFYKNMEICKNT